MIISAQNFIHNVKMYCLKKIMIPTSKLRFCLVIVHVFKRNKIEYKTTTIFFMHGVAYGPLKRFQ